MSTIPTRDQRKPKNEPIGGNEAAVILQPKFDRRSQVVKGAAVPTGLLITAGEWQHMIELLSLSTRESEIARFIFDDLAESAIAARLSISRHTVHTYIDRMYRKLHVHSRHQFLLLVFNTHLSYCGSRDR